MIYLIALLTFPVLTALGAYVFKNRQPGLWLLLGAVGHCGLSILVCRNPEANSFLGITSGSDITLLSLTSILYLSVCVYLYSFLYNEPGSRNARMLLALCMPLFLSAMTLVIAARDFALLWVAVEATTLASAPLILLHRSKASVEAMWKYLLICSTGIALALFGTLLLAMAARQGGVAFHGMSMADFMVVRNKLEPRLAVFAFVFILAGYGTKMGLVPFHTWLPDAHSEAPGAVSALLSAGLLNTAFISITRFMAVMPAAAAHKCSNMLTLLGFLSLATAALFIIKQSDFKRMLAYSSVEHMGVVAIIYAHCSMDTTIFHMLGHSLVKMALFLLAGNMLFAWRTRRISQVSGLFETMPRTAVLWFTGLVLICGVPPSPLFVTELQLLLALPLPLAITAAILLFMVFAGMFKAGLEMCMGKGSVLTLRKKKAEKLIYIPAAALLLALALAGILMVALC